MNWNFFKKIASEEYGLLPDGYPYSLEECLSVFQCFFDNYLKWMGCKHPPLKREHILRIMEKMPHTEAHHNTEMYLEPEAYSEMIEAYFFTDFQNCDFRINHFFSGQIRELKAYETGNC